MKVAMIGHKVVPSRRGGIENVLTTLCPVLREMGLEITCYNRSSDKVENEYVGTVDASAYDSLFDELSKNILLSYQACPIRSNGICDFFRFLILFIRNQCPIGIIKNLFRLCKGDVIIHPALQSLHKGFAKLL